MPTYLYRIWPDRPELLTAGPTPDEERVISAHYEYLRTLTERGVVLLAGRTRSGTTEDFGIVILVADSLADARRVMEADPAVMHGVFVGDLLAYDVALLSREIHTLIGHAS